MSTLPPLLMVMEAKLILLRTLTPKDLKFDSFVRVEQSAHMLHEGPLII